MLMNVEGKDVGLDASMPSEAVRSPIAGSSAALQHAKHEIAFNL